MDSACIPYTKLPKSSALFLDYLYHFDRVSRFYNGSPFEIETLRRVGRELHGVAYPRRELVEILLRQNRGFGCGEATLANVRRLAQPETLAVVTGQQVGLFSGPAYTLYKALTCVRLAQHLSEQGIPCVPVFWLATEDHDLAEVARTGALDDQYNWVELADPGVRPAPHSSVGYVRLSRDITATLDTLAAALPAGDARNQLLADLGDCYQPGASWGEAFGRFLARVLAKWGVVFLDPLDESIHRLCAPWYEQAIEQAAELRARLLERSRALIAAGYHAQVHVGDDSTLLFAANEGDRSALHQAPADGFLLGGRRLTKGEALAQARNQPLDFTASAVFRPVVQDRLLPTVAYVAGPAELAYHAQTASLYPAFGRPQPVIFPRAAFTLVDARTERILKQYNLRVEDAWEGEKHLQGKLATVGFAPGWAERLAETGQSVAAALARLGRDVTLLDPSLNDLLRHTENKMQYQVERLRGKITRAAMARSEILQRHAQALLHFLTPQGDLQERELSGVYFLGRAGYALLGRLLERINVTCSDHQTMSY